VKLTGGWGREIAPATWRRNTRRREAQEGRGLFGTLTGSRSTALDAGSKALKSRDRPLVKGGRFQRHEGMTRPVKAGTAPRRGTNPWRANPGRGCGMKQAREDGWRSKPSRA
jgi:hypothetical protein